MEWNGGLEGKERGGEGEEEREIKRRGRTVKGPGARLRIDRDDEKKAVGKFRYTLSIEIPISSQTPILYLFIYSDVIPSVIPTTIHPSKKITRVPPFCLCPPSPRPPPRPIPGPTSNTQSSGCSHPTVSDYYILIAALASSSTIHHSHTLISPVCAAWACIQDTTWKKQTGRITTRSRKAHVKEQTRKVSRQAGLRREEGVPFLLCCMYGYIDNIMGLLCMNMYQLYDDDGMIGSLRWINQ